MIDQEGIKIELEVIDQDARVMLVSVSGYVDQANCYLMQDTIDKCLGDKFFCLVFDLQKLMYMSSAGWGVLIGEIKRFRENGGDIKLANMGPEIYEIYQMLEFYHIISEYPSAEDALKSFNIKSDEFSEEVPEKEVTVEEEQPAAEENLPEEEILEVESPVAEEEETPAEDETEETVSSGEDLVEEDISEEGLIEEDASEEELVEDDASLTEAPVDKESFAEEPSASEDASEEDNDTVEEVSVEEVEEDLDDDRVEEEADIEETLDEESEEESEPEETTEPEEQDYYIEEDSIDELPLEDEKPEKPKKPRRFKETAHSEKTPEKKDTSDDNPQVILEDEIDINIEGFLANEGIAVSGPRKDKSNYVEFNPDKYNRKFDIKVMPIPDKIRDIVSRNPELSPRQIRNMLKQPEYGNVKISIFKFKSLLKALELDTKQKRYRYYRSA